MSSILLLCLLLICGVVIYYLSSQPYEAQNIRPFLSNFNLTWFEVLFASVSFTYAGTVISIEAYGGAEGFIEFFVRKGAHVIVFAVLGFLTYSLAHVLSKKRSIAFIMTLLVVSGYAAFDEWRQFHHPDRRGIYQDVILDIFGGIIGLSISYFYWRRKEVKKEKVAKNIVKQRNSA
ncbi:hypothetical protein AB990_02665 [Alkalihalobacillus pseudalcaliphilus]|nr:hypothetical protein AB990_02665 [Alkalihalobacillus pseudalcaliphilus]